MAAALAHHDLPDTIAAAIDVALARAQRQRRVSAPVRWHRFHEASFSVGRTAIEIDDGLLLGIYSAERSLIDAFRLRHQEGEEAAIEALRRRLKRPGSAPASLLAMASLFPKTEPALLQAFRILCREAEFRRFGEDGAGRLA